jgi:hypothetical protein
VFLLQVFFVFAIFMFRETRFFRNLGSFAKLRNSRNSSLIFAKQENSFVASFAKRNFVKNPSHVVPTARYGSWCRNSRQIYDICNPACNNHGGCFGKYVRFLVPRHTSGIMTGTVSYAATHRSGVMTDTVP